MDKASAPLVRSALVALVIACAFLAMLLPAAAHADETTDGSSQTLIADTSDQNIEVVDSSAVVVSKPTLSVRAKVQDKGWQAAVTSGKRAGTKTKKSLRAFKISLTDLGDLSGHIKYRTYDMGKGWGAIASDGKSSGRASRAVRAVKIWLTGAVAKRYDVKYRTYIKGRGWLPWVSNRAAAGSTAGSWYVSAIQVKLVAKKVDPNKTTLNGIDIASWQAGLDPALVDADFVIVKSTEGTWYTNPYFRKWADATLASGKLLGTYHFASVGDAVKQADYFVQTVGDYVGKCALFLDWEADAISQGPAWAKKFMNRVYKKTGVRPLIYMSKSVCRNYDWSSVAPTYGLWVAQYAYKYQDKGTGYLSEPWTDDSGYGAWAAPTIYQYTSKGYISGYSKNLDLNLFYGDVSAWKALQTVSQVSS